MRRSSHLSVKQGYVGHDKIGRYVVARALFLSLPRSGPQVDAEDAGEVDSRVKNYASFLAAKSQSDEMFGFAPSFFPYEMFDFQKFLLEWSVRKGRAAILADCGTGKTLMELAWSENIVRHHNARVLILAPLAVSSQTVREGEKFGIECRRSMDGSVTTPITITNYERLHLFNPEDFIGVVADESSILKNFSGKRRSAVTDFMRKRPYRLLCSATAAPNDYMELGTSSEALGYLGHMDMLSKFFKNDQNSNHPNRLWAGDGKWRFRGHAERDFWRWVCSWARALRKPSDLGFDDGAFKLPPLTMREHVVTTKKRREGLLFDLPAITLAEQREERRRTIGERCEMVADLVNHTGKPALVWCHLNDEGDLLERLIPDAIQVSGKDCDDAKEERLMGFVDGKYRVLITKHKIAGYGLNLQHCAHQTTFPSHSWEMFYQGLRRLWRFGQENEVTGDIVSSEGEAGVLANMKRKSEAAEKMFARIVEAMGAELYIGRTKEFTNREEMPSWLS